MLVPFLTDHFPNFNAGTLKTDPFPNFLSFLTLQREERIGRCLGLLLSRKGLSRTRANLVLAANAHFPVPEIFREYIAN
jgi:hypothetical protein